MTELKGGTHYLVLHEPTKNRHFVESFGKFDRAIGSWRNSGTRTSPILSLNGAPEPKLDLTDRAWIIFFGPVHPSRVEPHPGIDFYLSYGLLNIVAIGHEESPVAKLLDWVKAHGWQYEVWTIDRGELANWAHSAAPTSPALDKPLPSLYGRGSALCSAGREYLALISESVGRASIYTPDAATELRDFDRSFRGPLLEDSTLPIPLRQSLLVNANAALSRYTSQTYAGTSPLITSVCHYWTHSLLGIGMASIALVQLRRFVDKAIRDTDLISRVERYSQLPKHPNKHLESIPPLDDFWKRDFLQEAGEALKQHPPGANDDFVPILTYFSGRDGFRASKVALSAPLELLETCNSLPWTLMTITHEISHVIVDGFLPVLLPNPRDLEALNRCIRLMRGPDECQSLLDQLVALVGFSIWRLANESGQNQRLTPAMLQQCIESQWHNFCEVITHCFDFLYFYKGDADLYIPAVWASWSVIPDIEHRVREYIVRTLCALFANNLRRKDGLEVTIDQLLNRLKGVKARFPDALYVEQAISDLEQNRTNYSKALGQRRPIVLLVRQFLHSPDVAAKFVGEARPTDFKCNVFDDQLVGNPLSFIQSFSKDEAPTHARSAWLLQQLACGGGF